MSDLQSEAKRVFAVCVLHGISIESEWVPRSSNEQADYLRRIVDFDDWCVSPHIFRFLDFKWGTHSIDRSADEHNHLVPRFDSRFWNPYCEAMDFFTRSWDFDNNWVCPPPHLVPRTLRHMRSCCAQGTLIVMCFSQWVPCAVPLSSTVSFSLISFACSASGWPGCSLGGIRSFFCCSYFSRSRPLGWAALALKRAAPKVCVFSCWDELRFRGE